MIHCKLKIASKLLLQVILVNVMRNVLTQLQLSSGHFTVDLITVFEVVIVHTKRANKFAYLWETTKRSSLLLVSFNHFKLDCRKDFSISSLKGCDQWTSEFGWFVNWNFRRADRIILRHRRDDSIKRFWKCRLTKFADCTDFPLTNAIKIYTELDQSPRLTYK